MNKLLLIGLFCLPLKHMALTSSFGYRVHPVTRIYAFHSGVDLKARHDTVFAVMPGRVNASGYDRFLGVFINISHGCLKSSYGHLSQFFVLPGDSVNAGSPIGITGATGRVTGEHLHFGIQFKQHYIDPLIFLNAISNHLSIKN